MQYFIDKARLMLYIGVYLYFDAVLWQVKATGCGMEMVW